MENRLKDNKSKENKIITIILIIFLLLTALISVLLTDLYSQPLEKIAYLGIAVAFSSLAITMYIREVALKSFEKKFGKRKTKIILHTLDFVGILASIVIIYSSSLLLYNI